MSKTLGIKFKTLSPLFIADGSGGGAHINDEGYIYDGKGINNTPITRTERKPVIRRAEDNPAHGEVVFLPYIKANNLANRLRRFAQDVISELYIANDRTMSISVYNTLACGAASGTPIVDNPDFERIRSGRKSVYFGLFGGGRDMLESQLKYADLDPATPEFAESLGLDDEEVIDLRPSRLTYPISIVRRDRLMEGDDLHLEQLFENAQETYDEWIGRIMDSKANKAAKEEDDSVKYSREQIRNKVAVEAVVTGMLFKGNVRIPKYISDAQIGMLLECLRRFGEQNAMGGKSARGFGRFEMIVSIDNEPIFKTHDGEFTQLDDKYDEYDAELNEALSSFDFDELEALC